MAKVIMHIDLNAFFATAETIKDPSLEGRPLVVAGTSRRGIVSTASYEARSYGIHSAMPTYQARQLCSNLIILPGDYEYYQKLSHEFFEYLKTYSPIIEPASIDEGYVDITEQIGNVSDPMKYLRDIQNGLYEKTKLKCSIGIGPTKFLAKMASDMKKPMGITIIRRKDVQKILWPLPIKDMFGIGKKTYPRLESLGIYKIGDLATTESLEVKKLLGKSFDTFKAWANGYGSDEVNTEPSDPKSIGNSRTFLYDTSDYDEIREMIYMLSQEVSLRAKNENKIGSTITCVIKDTSFKSFSRSITLNDATNELDVIFNEALKLYEKNFISRDIRLVGVTLSSLKNKKNVYVQMDLFSLESEQKKHKTRLLVNSFNRCFDKDVLMICSDMNTKEKD